MTFRMPSAATCALTPYTFHPMYSSSGPDTRVPWAAHSYNIAFADEIGHFEYCSAVDPATGNCTAPGATDGTLDNDDTACFAAAQSTRAQITGCTGADNDFDGPEYANNWPGTGSLAHQAPFDAQPIEFTSPVFDGFHRYSQVAFEADLPRIEEADLKGPGPFCNVTTGANCVNPPAWPAVLSVLHHGQQRRRLQLAAWRRQPGRDPEHVRRFLGCRIRKPAQAHLCHDHQRSPGAAIRMNDFQRVLPNPC